MQTLFFVTNRLQTGYYRPPGLGGKIVKKTIFPGRLPPRNCPDNWGMTAQSARTHRVSRRARPVQAQQGGKSLGGCVSEATESRNMGVEVFMS